MRIVKLTLQYDGTEYVGWQRQARGTSIQGLVESALERIEGRRVAVTGASRTDAGVHALGQVASVPLTHAIDCKALRRALNATLPGDVRVALAEDAPPAFHARYDARSKTYRYRILNTEIASPFERAYAWHQPMPLDLARMREAAVHLHGRHDFAAFQSTGSDPGTTIRTVNEVRILGEPSRLLPGGTVVVVEVTGSGFLRHMVRTIVGTLVETGAGRRTADRLAALVSGRDRAQAGPTAPAHGLFLVRVAYDPT